MLLQLLQPRGFVRARQLLRARAVVHGYCLLLLLLQPQQLAGGHRHCGGPCSSGLNVLTLHEHVRGGLHRLLPQLLLLLLLLLLHNPCALPTFQHLLLHNPCALPAFHHLLRHHRGALPALHQLLLHLRQALQLYSRHALLLPRLRPLLLLHLHAPRASRLDLLPLRALRRVHQREVEQRLPRLWRDGHTRWHVLRGVHHS